MGANAQTSVPLFAAGQVLTAANQNLSAGTGVPVFADATARNAAFGGSGEKVLAEGQLAYLEDLNVVQYYDGAAWATVGPSTAGGLVFITGATFTTATSFSLPDNTFSATYDNYKIMINLTTGTDADFTLRLRAAGTDTTSTNYNTQLLGINASGSASNSAAPDATSFAMGEQDAGLAGYSAMLDVFSPNLATNTRMFSSITFVNKAASTTISRTGSFWIGLTTQYDSLSFISSVASSITGTYRVYGYANS